MTKRERQKQNQKCSIRRVSEVYLKTNNSFAGLVSAASTPVFQTGRAGSNPVSRSTNADWAGILNPPVSQEKGLKEETPLPKRWLVVLSPYKSLIAYGQAEITLYKLAKGAENPSVDLVSTRVRTSLG